MKSNISFALIFILILTSCNSGRSKKDRSAGLPYLVEVEKNLSNPRSIPLRSIGERLEYIPLETNPESMLARAINIAMTDSYIFVSDGEKIVEFNKEGKYIRNISSQGRGPGQYLNLCDFCVSESKPFIFILDEKALLVYDFNGNFVESARLPFLSLSFTLRDESNLMYYSANLPGLTSDTVYSWYVTDFHGKNLIRFKNYHQRANRGTPIGNSPLYLFGDAPRFMEFGSDTLLMLSGSKPEPYAILNSGDYKMDPDPDIQSTNREEVFKRLKYKLWPIIMDEDDRNLYITYVWGFSGTMSTSVFNKKTLETTFLEGNAFINDLDGGLPFWPRYIYDDNILVDQADALSLIKKINELRQTGSPEKGAGIPEQLELLSNQLTENSNPVLIVLKR